MKYDGAKTNNLVTFAISTNNALGAIRLQPHHSGLFIFSREKKRSAADHRFHPQFRNVTFQHMAVATHLREYEAEHLEAPNSIMEVDLRRRLGCNCELVARAVEKSEVATHIVHLPAWIAEHMYEWPLVVHMMPPFGLTPLDSLMDSSHPITLRGLPTICLQIPKRIDVTLFDDLILPVFLASAKLFRHQMTFVNFHDPTAPDLGLHGLHPLLQITHSFATGADPRTSPLSAGRFADTIHRLCDSFLQGTITGVPWSVARFVEADYNNKQHEIIPASLQPVTVGALQSMLLDPLRQWGIVALFCMYSCLNSPELVAMANLSEEYASPKLDWAHRKFVWVRLHPSNDMDKHRIDVLLPSIVQTYQFPLIVSYPIGNDLPAAWLFKHESEPSIDSIRNFITQVHQ